MKVMMMMMTINKKKSLIKGNKLLKYYVRKAGLEDCSTELLQPLRNICYRTSRHVFVARLAVLRISGVLPDEGRRRSELQDQHFCSVCCLAAILIRIGLRCLETAINCDPVILRRWKHLRLAPSYLTRLRILLRLMVDPAMAQVHPLG